MNEQPIPKRLAIILVNETLAKALLAALTTNVRVQFEIPERIRQAFAHYSGETPTIGLYLENGRVHLGDGSTYGPLRSYEGYNFTFLRTDRDMGAIIDILNNFKVATVVQLNGRRKAIVSTDKQFVTVGCERFLRGPIEQLWKAFQ